MTLAEQTKHEIARLLEEGGWRPELSGERLRVHPLDLEVTCVEHTEEADEDSGCILVTAYHLERFPAGIADHCIGYGASAEELATTAAKSWLLQAFYVLHDLLCDAEPGSDVQVFEMVTRVDETGEVFGWRSYLSQMIFDASEGIEPAAVDQWEFIRALLGPLSSVLLDEQLHWLKCFVGIVPGHEAASECRFDGVLWEEGTEALDECAAQWPSGEFIKIRKQFMLFEPCKLAELKSGAELAEKAQAEGERK